MNATTAASPVSQISNHPLAGVSRRRDRARLLQVTEALISEFAEHLPAGAVIACVTRCKTELLASGVRNGLPYATHAAARIRLQSLVSVRGSLVSA
jgi:hypothetical protein